MATQSRMGAARCSGEGGVEKRSLTGLEFQLSKMADFWRWGLMVVAQYTLKNDSGDKVYVMCI